MTAAEDATTPPSLADAVNARLTEFGWSRGTLAARSWIDYATVAKVCRGTHGRAPSRRTLSRLDVALDWPDGYAESMVPGGAHRPERALEGHRSVRPGPKRRATTSQSPTTVPAIEPSSTHRNVMHLDVPPVTTAPTPHASELTLPDPALRWRSPRNLAGRVEQVERWTYALAVARILVKEAEAPA